MLDLTRVVKTAFCSVAFGFLGFGLTGVGASALAQEFKNSIVSTDFDFIVEDDPSTFLALKFVEKVEAEMPSKHSEDLLHDAFVFAATFGDKTHVSIFVDAKIGDADGAKEVAMKFVQPLGKLPTALRKGVDRLCVHKGGKDSTAFSDVGLIVMYSDNADVRIGNHDLEETIFHESVHAAWDQQHASSEGWKRAQGRDGNFATLYAKSKPMREDLAESALFAYTLIHHPDRLPKAVQARLRKAIPARILYIADLLPPNKPIHFSVEAKSTNVLEEEVPCNVSRAGTAADIISNCLLVDFKIDEKEVRKLVADAGDRYGSGEEVFQAALKAFDIEAGKLRASILSNLHTNCDHGDNEIDDAPIRELIKGWQAK